MVKLTLTSIFLLLFICGLHAQFSIRVRVSSAKDGSFINNATVTVTNIRGELLTDSLQYTDKDGSVLFSIAEKQFTDTVWIYTSADGFASGRQLLSKQSVSSNTTTEIRISLNIVSHTLKEVVVQSGKKLLERKPDRWVLSPGQNPNMIGNTPFESLRLLPGISVVNDNVKVNGKSGLRYLINDHIAFLPNQSVEEFLKTLSADQIERIELLTNPPAKYSAEGSAAIINVVLKKNVLRGVTGKVASMYEQGVYAGNRNNFSIDYKDYLFETSFIGAANFNHAFSDGSENRLYPVNNGITFQNRYFEKHTTSALSAFQTFNWQTGKKAWLEVAYQISNNKDNQPLTSVTNVYSPTKLDSVFNTSTLVKDNTFSYGFNSNYKLQWGTVKKSELEVNASYFNNSNPVESAIENNFLYPDYTKKRPTLSGNIDNKFKAYLLGGAVDYSVQLPIGLLEAGVRASASKNNSDFRFAYGNAASAAGIVLQQNQFRYREHIEAGYITQSFSLDSSWEFKVGLRAERTTLKGESEIAGKVLDSNYFQLFPTFYVSRKIGKQIDFSLNYGRRITRPDFRDLNPFTYYYDPYSYISGNPFLRPYYMHNIETELGFADVVFVTLGYSRANNVIADVTLQDDATRIVYATKGNIATQNSFFSSIETQLEPFDWWNISGGVNMGHDSYEGSYGSYHVQNRLFTWSANVYNIFNLGHKWRASIGGWMNGPSTTGIDYYKTLGQLDISAEKKIGSWSIQFGCKDLLRNHYERVETKLGNQNISLLQKHDYRRGWVRIAWSINNRRKSLKEKAGQKKNPFDTEESRLN